MARKIFSPEPESKSPSPSPATAPKLPGSVGGLRDSLREITANSIRDLESEKIEIDGLRDRIALDDSSIDELAESIRKHGQQVPIMVRPSDQPDRFRIVYGRRRLAAIRKTGGTVKAIVRSLDDDASLIAQGQENNLRLDPSFIEKALFIREMQEAGYKPTVIQDALGLTRQGVSNHRVVIEQLPTDLVRLIGPAHGIGRRQWAELGAQQDQNALIDLARGTLAALPSNTPSTEKFQAVYAAVKQSKRGQSNTKRSVTKTAIVNQHGVSVATMSGDKKSVTIEILRKDNPEFSRWIEEKAEDILRAQFDQWQNESGSGS